METIQSFFHNLLRYLRAALSHYAFVPLAFTVGFILWYLKLSIAAVAVFSAVFVLIVAICKDVKNIFALTLYIPFFITNIYRTDNKTAYLICIVAAISSLIIRTIYTVIKKGKSFRKGTLFYPLLLADAAFLIGGITVFNFTEFITVFGISTSIFCFYLIAVNATEDLLRFLPYLFLVGALFVLAEIIVARLLVMGNLTNLGTPEGVFYFSAQVINVAALYILLGVVSCLKFGLKSKYDFLFLILAFVLAISEILTRCRMVLLITAFAGITVAVLLYIYSENKKRYLFSSIALLVFCAIACFILRDKVQSMLTTLWQKQAVGVNGRDALYGWCIEKFKSHPFFGIGFVADVVVPSLMSEVLLAHNTVLQYLTSTGIIGTVMIAPLYFFKYKTATKRFSIATVTAFITILCIAFSGITDQAASADAFVFFITLILPVSIEQYNLSLKSQEINCSSIKEGSDNA